MPSEHSHQDISSLDNLILATFPQVGVWIAVQTFWENQPITPIRIFGSLVAAISTLGLAAVRGIPEKDFGKITGSALVGLYAASATAITIKARALGVDPTTAFNLGVTIPNLVLATTALIVKKVSNGRGTSSSLSPQSLT